jgi:hypothetical protein
MSERGPPPGTQGEVWVDIVEAGPAVRGRIVNNLAFGDVQGFLAGVDPVFNELAGVYGESNQAGVFGNSNVAGATGVHGRGGGAGGFGLRGEISGSGGAAVKGQVFGAGPALAGEFDGNVTINGHLNMGGAGNVTLDSGNLTLGGGALTLNGGNLTLGNGGDVFLADCAEEFQFAACVEIVEPGCVMVLDDQGHIRPCDVAHDRRAVGVVSGAGPYRPAIVLDRVDAATDRAPIALFGKVFCKVDAAFGPVEVGDLLTTSTTTGHAMKAADPLSAFGAVIGKALAPLRSGQDMIPILVVLQ